MSVSPGWGDTHRPPQRGCGCSRWGFSPHRAPQPQRGPQRAPDLQGHGGECDGVSRPRNPGCVPPGDTRVPAQVLEELRGPAGPQLQLTQPFRSTAARAELETFVRQFLQM